MRELSPKSESQKCGHDRREVRKQHQTNEAEALEIGFTASLYACNAYPPCSEVNEIGQPKKDRGAEDRNRPHAEPGNRASAKLRKRIPVAEDKGRDKKNQY